MAKVVLDAGHGGPWHEIGHPRANPHKYWIFCKKSYVKNGKYSDKISVKMLNGKEIMKFKSLSFFGKGDIADYTAQGFSF